MKDQFVPYELALKLKELGFDEECFGLYNNPDTKKVYHNSPKHWRNSEVIDFIICAPLWQQAFDWFEEKYDFHINIFGVGLNGELKGFYYSITEEGWINYYESVDSGKWYDTKEEARQACLEKLIELCG